MNKLTLVLFYSLLFVSAAFLKVSAQQVFKTTPTSVIPYLEYVPQDYNNNSDKYPIVIFLHGIGERGPNSTDLNVLSGAIQNVAKHGPPKYTKAGAQFPFILISPQLKDNNGTWPTSYVMEVINYCKTYLRIDERRIYLTGLSLGGGGTWWTAQDFPELFAAIAPVCGGYNSTSKACGISGENLPVWAFHGDVDTVVPLSKSQSMVNAINNCVPKPSPLAKLTVYTGVGHNAWDYAYKNDNTLHNPNVYQWLMSFINVYNRGNSIPVANAGADKTISLLNTTISGSATDTDGSINSYAWTKMSGGNVTLTNATSASLSIAGLTLGDYVFQLKVIDNSGNTDSDYIKISVFTNTNTAPVSNAGPDKTIALPLNSITVNGNGSDSDGSINAYQWSKVTGGTATLANTTSASLDVSSLASGAYVFRLAVTDNSGAIGIDEMQVNVNAAMVPLVNAGADKIVKLPTSSATISGSASDPNGTIVTYAWSKVSGGSCTMNSVNSSTLKLSNLVSGSYTFRLTATDSEGLTASDDILVSVDAPPVVNAGTDKIITAPLTSSLVLAGSATDADGQIVKYLWSKYSGPNVSCINTNTATLTINKMYEGVYVFKLAVTDELGAQGIDYVTITVTTSAITTSSSVIFR